MFLDEFEKYKPKIIIGLGQHRRCRKLRIERKALNLKSLRAKVFHPISKAGNDKLFCNLSLKKNKQTTITYNAGTYVCNYSMYLSLEYSSKNNSLFAFIHVPTNYNPIKAYEYIFSNIDKVKNEL